MRNYFEQGNTISYSFRRKQLQQLKESILKHEAALNEALYADLKKSKEEVWITETGMVLAEIDNAIKNLKKWMRPVSVRTNLVSLPGSSRIYAEPLGVVLLIAPWNYPFQLLFMPLVGAIAAGNSVVMKPSEFATETEKIMRTIIEEIFNPLYIKYVTGEGATIIPEMMNHFRFDHVFYVGSTAVGKIIYQMAAAQLVPVTLELGGKSPTIVTPSAKLGVAARRIANAKFSNAGQMCIAPDYVLVHQSVKDDFINELKNVIHQFYGVNPLQSYDFGKIINQKQIDRLKRYLEGQDVLTGGTVDEAKQYMAPSLINQPKLDDAIMKEEIFGPLLPIITYSNRQEAESIINKNPNPLAMYIYAEDQEEAAYWIQKIPFGGGCINSSALHYTNKNLPFGGRGNSGIGHYHGKYSFDTFSHKKSILKQATWIDIKFSYPSFKGKLKWLKKII